METAFLSELLLRGARIHPLVFIILIVFTGGICIVIYLRNNSKSDSAKRYETAKKDYFKKPEDYIFALAVAMIRADGKIEPEELAIAEAFGKKLYNRFNVKRFRNMVYTDQLTQNPERLAYDADQILSIDGKKLVLIYLQHIALSDGEMHKKEKKLLESIAKEWRLPIPEMPQDNSIGIQDIMYALAASVITADGIVEENEIVIASAIGKQFFEEFCTDELKAICSEKKQIPKPRKLATILSEHITDDGKEMIIKFLSAIAESANNDNEEGLSVVSEISDIWGLNIT